MQRSDDITLDRNEVSVCDVNESVRRQTTDVERTPSTLLSTVVLAYYLFIATQDDKSISYALLVT